MRTVHFYLNTQPCIGDEITLNYGTCTNNTAALISITFLSTEMVCSSCLTSLVAIARADKLSNIPLIN